MKACVILLCILPLVLSTPHERFLLDTLGIDADTLKGELQAIVDVVGSDPTEALCEQECGKVITDAVAKTSCPFICRTFQSLVHRFNIVPDTTTVSV